jgi:ligand-binding sensor domain-containing protein
MRIKLILLFNIFFLNLFSQQGQLSFKNFGVDQGFPSNETFDIEQDDEGRIWFATDKGVVVYDGNKTVVFTVKEGLISDVILEIVKDQFGRLWFITIENQLCYFENGKIVPYKFNYLLEDKKLKSTHGDHDLFVSKDSSLYFSIRSVGGIKITSKGKLTILNEEDGVSFFKIENNYFWTYRNQYFLLHRELTKMKLKFYDENDCSYITSLIPRNKIAITHNSEGALVLTNDIIIDLNSNKEIYSEPGIIKIFRYKNKLLVGFKNKGVKLFSYINGKLKLEDHFLEGYSVSSIFIDKNEGIWFSTLEDGIYYCSYTTIRNYNKIAGLKNISIWSISKYNKQIYLGFDQNEYVNWSTKEISFHHLGSTSVAFLQNYEGKLFISTGNGLVVNNEIVFKNFHINDFYEYKELYFISRELVGKFSFQKGVTLLNKLDASNMIVFEAIAVDHKGIVWLGNREGVYKLENEIPVKIELKGMPNKTRVKDMLFDEQFGFVLGTRGEGVRIKGRSDEHFMKIEDVNSNHVNCLFIDKKKRLWVGTDRGVNIIQINDNGDFDVISFSTEKGLISNEINTIFVDDTYAYIGTSKGLSTIALSGVDFKLKNCKIKLHRFLVDGYTIKSNIQNKEILIAHDKDRIEINFGTINFVTKGKYRYRLHKNSKWTEIDNPEITLYNLESGHYSLEVSFLDENNHWSTNQVIASFEIDSPYWEKNYFKFGILTFLCFLGYLFVRSKRKQFETKQKMVVLEQKALFAQMNPHFIFNTMNSIQSFLIYNENEKAEFFLLKFSKLLRETLHISRTSTVSIEKEISMLEKYLELEQMRFSKKFSFTIETKIPYENKAVRIPNMLLQPFLENALKHAFVGDRDDFKITLSMHYVNDKLVHCIIQDNGIGRIASEGNNTNKAQRKEHISYGEKITNERLDSYNRKLRSKVYYSITTDLYENSIPLGTKVEVFIPLFRDL